MSSIKFLRTILQEDIVKYIEEIIIFRKRKEILSDAKMKITDENLSSYEVRGIIGNVTFRLSLIFGEGGYEISKSREYKDLKKTVAEWVERDSWENEYNGGPYAYIRELNYSKLLKFANEDFVCEKTLINLFKIDKN